MVKESGKSKVNIRFEIDILSFEGVPIAYKSDGIVLHYKRSGSKTARGSSYPVLVDAPTTFFDPVKEKTRFIFNCRFFREALTGKFSPKKTVNIGLQLEKIQKSKKIDLGKCSIPLNDYAEDGTSELLVLSLDKSPIVAASLRLIVRTYWETIDGYALVSVAPREPENEEVKLREKPSKSARLKTRIRRTSASISLFPTGKVNVNGKTYELYDTADDDAPDASASLRSERGRCDTDVDFSCDEFDSDDEAEVAALASPGKINKKEKKEKLERHMSVALEKVESALLKGFKQQPPPAPTTTIANFEVTILSAEGIPGADGKHIFISWRRGAKKKNSGRTKKALCTDGSAEWTDLSDEPISVAATMTRDPKTQVFEEKTLGLNLKKITTVGESNKSIPIGHLIIDLSEYAKEGLDLTKSFPLTIKSRGGHPIMKAAATAALSTKPTIELNITCNIKQKIEQAPQLIVEEPVEHKEESDRKSNVSPAEPDTTVFGKPLLDQLVVDGIRKYDVPPIVTKLVQGVKERGLTRQGIFRLSGRSGPVNEMIETLNRNMDELEISECGPHELADCLKKYLRSLPNSLLPEKNYDACLHLGERYKAYEESNNPSESDRSEIYKDLEKFISELPPANTAVLRTLCALLFETKQNSEVNKMNIENVATVFAPTVIQKELADPKRILHDNVSKVSFMKLLISYSPNWKTLENFSEIDEQLRIQEETLDPVIRVGRLTARLKQKEVQLNELRNVIKQRDTTIEAFELEEFIFSTSTMWNSDKKMYQAAIEVHEKLNNLQAFTNFNSVYLFAVLRSFYLMHKRSIGDLRTNSFVLGVCLNLLELWQADEELLFCGDVVKYGVVIGDSLGKLDYDFGVLETWKPSEQDLHSPSHFEKQFQEFTLRVFYTICRTFPQMYKAEIFSLGTTETSFGASASASEKTLLQGIIELQNIVKDKKISNIIVTQITTGVFREIARFFVQDVAATPELCSIETGLKIKMNVTSFLHTIQQNTHLKVYQNVAQDEFQVILELANLFVSMNNFSSSVFPNANELIELFPDLSTRIVYNVLLNTSNIESVEHKSLILSQLDELLK